MAWIESHQEVGRHPKTKKLARLLGVSLPAAVGYLHYLWWWALDFAQDGTLEKFDGYDLADAMQWDGDPDELVKALISSGYIDSTEDGLVIHDWGEYAGKLLERRAKDRARKRAASEIAEPAQKFRRNSNGIDEERAEIRKDSFVTVPNSTLPNQTVPNSTLQNSTNTHSEALTLQERRFAEFWKAYPKKVGKASCLKAWKKLKPNTGLFNHIMVSLEAQKRTEQWQRDGGRFIPNPLTWLNQGRWDDEPTEVRGVNVTGKPSGTLGALANIVAEEEGDLH